MKKRSFVTAQKRPRKHSLAIKALFVALFFAVVLTLVGSSFLYYILLKEIPSIVVLKDYRPSISSRVYADNNELIDEFFAEDRKLIKVSERPKIATQANIGAKPGSSLRM